MSKENKQILFAFLLLFIFGLLALFVFDVKCIFKTLIGVPCPGCGLTRGFRALFSGHVLEAELYNIFTVPIFLFLVLCIVIMMVDIITKSNNTYKLLEKISNHYVVIIIALCLNWIINIIRGI